MSSPWEELARNKKVAALVDTLRAAHITAELAALMDPQDWIAAGKEAKLIHPPSVETQALVIAHLRAGEGR